MSFKTTLIAVFTVLGSMGLMAQPELPEDYRFDCVADYQANKELARDCITWLLENPIDQDEIVRSQLTAFSMKWLTGTPSLRLEFESAVMPFAAEFPDLMVIHMLGAARVVLERPETDRISYNLAGLNAVLQQVRMTEGLVDDEALSELMTLSESDSLRIWLAERLNR